MHCKYCVIDRKVVLTGSFNWSPNSELNSLENIFVIRDSSVAAQYRSKFMDMVYGTRYPRYADSLIKTQVERGERIGRCSFAPIVVTPTELEIVRSEVSRVMSNITGVPSFCFTPENKC
jgi:phosphatidylserine/phosphatidylglycerophosphate/cardiolipin synthase-like enzyme